jgi:Xaa-Pro aminopeptidase
VNYAEHAIARDETLDYAHHPLEHEFSQDEYRLRLRRARSEMARANLDALVITSSQVGSWFTGRDEPHSWHDQVPSRSTWFIVTPDDDYLYMTPTNNHNFASARRATWVSHVREIVERTEWPRVEIWGLGQIPGIFAELGLSRGRLGFELGDTMTLGISVNDFLALRELMAGAQLVDAGPAIRRLMAIQTPLEIERMRAACEAGVWIHGQVPRILRPGMTEREFFGQLRDAFAGRFGAGYHYETEGGWDIRNAATGDYHLYHHGVTDRAFREGDQICRGTSGASYWGYGGDVDRIWYIGSPPEIVRRWYRMTWECNRAMAAEIRPGARCSDVYAPSAVIERKFGLEPGRAGRRGHGLRNTGGLSVHPDNHTILELGMILSVEPMFGNRQGFYDLEDQYVVTEHGAECLHELAPEALPILGA